MEDKINHNDKNTPWSPRLGYHTYPVIKWCSIKAVPRSYLNNKIQTNVCKTKYMYKPLFFRGETDASSFSTAKSSDKHIQLTGNSQRLK